HFEIAGRQFLAFEQKIDAAVLAVADLAPNFRILHERLDRFCREGFSDEVVRMRSVDADELQARSEIHFDKLPAISELAFRIVGFGEPHPRARRVQAEHCARISDMRRDFAAVRQHNIGQETLVAPLQGRGNERRRETHQFAILPPSSSSICTRMMSSKLFSTSKPSSRARLASTSSAQSVTMAAITGSGLRLIRAA